MSNELTPEILRQRVKDYLEHYDTPESPTPHEDWALIYQKAATAWEADKQRIAELTTLRPMSEAPENEAVLFRIRDQFTVGTLEHVLWNGDNLEGFLPIPEVKV